MEDEVPQDEKLLPPGVPSHKAQSWGVLISIVIIVMMVTVGAFYAWGKRIAQNQEPTAAVAP
jgi:NADH:ubiquinone oxidoreductase subunit 3 (subunit A)